MEDYKYNIIVEWAKKYISEKGIRADERFLSENELCAIHNVSRQTVRQALGKLESEGVICRVRGSGTFVARTEKGNTPNIKTVGVVSTYFSDYIFPSIVTGIEKVLKRNNIAMQLSITHNQVFDEAQALRTMIAQGVSGIIVEPSKSALSASNEKLYEEIREMNIPLVFFNARYPWADFPCVAMDDEAAGKIVTDHLLDMGHKRLCGIFALDDRQGHDRYHGYIKSCEEHGISYADNNVMWYSTDEREELFSHSEERIMKLLGRSSGVVCYNDKLAVELMNFCGRKGIRVPEELSVVGIDDSKLSVLCDVKLTTVRHPQQKLGEAAAHKLLDIMAAPERKYDDIKFAPVLVERESVCCIK